MTARAAVLIGPLALSGCGPGFVASAAYPDGKTYSFRSADSESVIAYACAAQGPGGSQDARPAAHRFFDAESQEFAETEVSKLFADFESARSDREIARGMNARADAWAEATALEMERRFRCLMVGVCHS